MNKTTLAVLVILTVALAAWAGDTGLGTSPFTSGDQLTATAVNAMNDAINDKTLELDDLSDSTSPHNIVENETRGFIISNGNASADAVLDFEDSALAEGRDFCVVIEAAYQITIEPDTDENWYLNGTQCGANDAIFNDDDTVGEMLCCISTERNMFCVSQDANWECE
jgi:hypothetical protein